MMLHNIYLVLAVLGVQATLVTANDFCYQIKYTVSKTSELLQFLNDKTASEGCRVCDDFLAVENVSTQDDVILEMKKYNSTLYSLRLAMTTYLNSPQGKEYASNEDEFFQFMSKLNKTLEVLQQPILIGDATAPMNISLLTDYKDTDIYSQTNYVAINLTTLLVTWANKHCPEDQVLF